MKRPKSDEQALSGRKVGIDDHFWTDHLKNLVGASLPPPSTQTFETFELMRISGQDQLAQCTIEFRVFQQSSKIQSRHPRNTKPKHFMQLGSKQLTNLDGSGENKNISQYDNIMLPVSRVPYNPIDFCQTRQEQEQSTSVTTTVPTGGAFSVLRGNAFSLILFYCLPCLVLIVCSHLISVSCDM